MPTPWSTPVGAWLTREERMTLYGGGKQGGIEPSATTPNVFTYSDPERGRRYGYTFDGWDTADGVFLFTGEGRVGDQLMREGNRAVLHHRDESRSLRLFVADGVVVGTRTRTHRYIGEFEVDPHEPFTQEDAPDVNGEMRTVFVFRLRPLNGHLHRPQDTASSHISPSGSAEAFELGSPKARHTTVRATAGSTAELREAQLVDRYRRWLITQGHKVGGWRLKPPGALTRIVTDLYDFSRDELYEAKGTATRDAIRMAIGQLFDYRRHIPRPKIACAVLLPHEPARDIRDLIASVGFGCVFETADDQFERISPS